MKSIFLFRTKLMMYWVLLPLLILLGAACYYNQFADNFLKLYPIITVTVGGIIFIVIYFFRGIKISYDEIRDVGLFSGRDSAMINEGKTLILKRVKHGRVEITLFGNDGVTADLDWLKSTGEAPRDISLFRGKAIGGLKAIRRIMSFFDVPKDDIELALKNDGFSCNYDLVSVNCEEIDECAVINIRINKTI